MGSVVILDDSKESAEAMANTVRRLGFDAAIETSAEAFFARVTSQEPDFILLDLLMPNTDGVEVMRQLASQGCGCAIIITSGVQGRVLEAARRIAVGRGLRVAGVLAKPFRRAALIELLSHTPPLMPPADTSETSGPPAALLPVAALETALAKQQFGLDFQPKVDCATGALRGFEALVRWPQPDGSVVTPDMFIPAVESTGLIGPLTDQIIDMGLAQLAELFPDREVSLSFNVSPFGARDIDFADRAARLCAKHGIDTDRITFELTETGTMADAVAGLDMFTRLRMKGFRLSIDDFGIGYSSMKQLIQLPFSEIKIDKTFVSALTRSAEAWTAVRSITALAKELGLTVVAEGVEDHETLARLVSIRCDQAQGFWTGRPMAPDALRTWLEQRR